MKRILLILSAALLSCATTLALPLGNPSEASMMCDGLLFEGPCADFCQSGVSWCDAWSLRTGFYGDYVFQRHIEVDHGSEPDIEHFAHYTNAGYLALNFWDKVDLFGTLGASNLRIESNASTFQVPTNAIGNRIVLESQTDFSWSIGLRSTLWECGCLSVGAEAQYFYTNPDLSYIDRAYTEGSYPDGLISMKFREWQIGLGAAYRIWNFVPYAGVKYSHVDLDMGDASIQLGTIGIDIIASLLRDANLKLPYGYVVGVSIIDCEKASLTVEARFPDETALYVNGQIRF